MANVFDQFDPPTPGAVPQAVASDVAASPKPSFATAERRLRFAKPSSAAGTVAFKIAAEKAAADDHRSLTQLVEKLLADYLRSKGYLK